MDNSSRYSHASYHATSTRGAEHGGQPSAHGAVGAPILPSAPGPVVLVLAGLPGSGKSTAARFLAQKGWVVINQVRCVRTLCHCLGGCTIFTTPCVPWPATFHASDCPRAVRQISTLLRRCKRLCCVGRPWEPHGMRGSCR